MILSLKRNSGELYGEHTLKSVLFSFQVRLKLVLNYFRNSSFFVKRLVSSARLVFKAV